MVSQEKCVFFCDGRYAAQAKEEVKGARIVVGKLSAIGAATDWLRANSQTAQNNVGNRCRALDGCFAGEAGEELGQQFSIARGGFAGRASPNY